MNFYNQWCNVRLKGGSQNMFFMAFFDYKKSTLDPLFFGTNEEVLSAIDFILQIDINEFIKNAGIKVIKINEVTPGVVSQYSNFEKGTSRLCEILDFAVSPLTRIEIGEKLGAKTKYACAKYGENHIKLGMLLSLVYEKDNGKYNLSNLGKQIIIIELGKQKELLRRLLLRNVFMRFAIQEACNTTVNYYNLCESLKKSTMDRRKKNNKYLLELVLQNSKYSYILKNIEWCYHGI